jgi:hypothetical protein
MQMRTCAKASGYAMNHAATLARDKSPTLGLTVKTRVRAGGNLREH